MKNNSAFLIRFYIIAAILITINILSSIWHAKLDLTDDKKYTLSKPTQNLLANLKEDVKITIMLKGDLPANYQNLLNNTLDLIKNFAEASHHKVKVETENPFEGKTLEDKIKIGKDLAKKGINPMPLTEQLADDQGQEQRLIIPYATVATQGRETPVCLLENHLDMDMDGILNYSQNMLEYKMASAIKNMQKADKESIAYIVGHNEILNYNALDALQTLGSLYNLDTLDITQNYEIPEIYKCAIICRPAASFDDKTKFKIDQYLMAGGRIIWYVDGINCNLDTLQKSPSYMASTFDNNLDDLFFKYGFRLNTNVVEDMQCSKIPVTVGMVNNTPDIRLLDWVYFPEITPISKHPIVNNMDAVIGKFSSTLDTIQTPGTKKTILLATSGYSRTLPAPVVINMNSLKYKPKIELFNKKYLPLAIALEGDFNSLFANRIPDANFLKIYKDSLRKTFRTQTAKPTKMIVVADADMMLNDFSPKRGPAELGFYGFTGRLYANKSFLLNSIEYLSDDNALLEARNKDVKLRLLDKRKLKSEKVKWQIINLLIPIALFILLGNAYMFFRKKKYAQPLEP